MSNNFPPEDEKALFREAMRTVKPLGKTNRLTLKSTPPSPPLPTRKKAPPSPTLTHEYNLSNYYSTVVEAESILSYGHQSLLKKHFNQLKKGQRQWQARLDLHGLTIDTARDALCRFIEAQHARGARCLLIIHGKGGQHGNVPVLKNHVNHWLQQLPQVLAFHSAQPKEGGSGAVYVLLRKI